MNSITRGARFLLDWIIELKGLLGIFAIGALVGLVFWAFSTPASTARPDFFASSGHHAPSWELVPGNNCWNDKAGVLRQLKAFQYQMAWCAHNDGGLVTEWWTRDHWPTVVARQHYAGAPITMDSVYYPSTGGSMDQWLVVVPGPKPAPVTTVIDAATSLLFDTARLHKLPAKVDCPTDTHVAHVNVVTDGTALQFDFRYDVLSGSRIVRPKSCPLA